MMRRLRRQLPGLAWPGNCGGSAGRVHFGKAVLSRLAPGFFWPQGRRDTEIRWFSYLRGPEAFLLVWGLEYSFYYPGRILQNEKASLRIAGPFSHYNILDNLTLNPFFAKRKSIFIHSQNAKEDP